MSLQVTDIPDTGGAVTFWRLAEKTSLNRLDKGIRAFSPELADLAPGRRSPLTCLREAILAVSVMDKTKSILVPLDDRSGFAVIESAGEKTIAPGDTWGKVTYVVKFVNNLLEIDPFDSGRLSRISDVYYNSLGYITAQMAGKYLVDICKNLGGSSLRDRGGIYWLHESALHLWAIVAEAFSEAADGNNTVYLVRHRLDMDSAKAVLDAVIEETQHDLETIKAEILSGKLGEKALITKGDQCERLVKKLTSYEQFLGVSFEAMKELASQMTDAQAFASLMHSIEQEKMANAS